MNLYLMKMPIQHLSSIKKFGRQYLRGIKDVDAYTRGVFIGSTVLFVLGSIYLTQLYLSYQLNGADFGSYVHMFSTTVSGDGFLSFGRFGQNLHPWNSYWGEHFTVTLLLFVPVFLVFPDPITLLVAKSFVLAASIPALWFLARETTESNTLSVVLVTSYALNPFLWSAWTFDFQEQILVPVFVFALYYFYQRGRNKLSLLCVGLVLLTNEFLIFIVFGYLSGVALSEYTTGRLRAQLPYIVTGYGLVGLQYVISGTVMDAFSESSGLPVATLSGVLQDVFTQNSVSFGTLFVTMVESPDVILDSLLFDAQTKVLFFLLFLIPVGFLALFDELSLGAMAPFLVFAWLFAGRSHFYMFGAHYPLYLLPFIYIGATRQLAGLTSSLTVPALNPQAAVQVVMVVLVVSSGVAVAGGAQQSGIQLPVPAAQTDHTRTMDAAVDEVPPTASMVTQNNLYPKVADRTNARYIVRPDLFYERQEEFGTYAPDYILYDTESDPFWADRVSGPFADRLGTEYGLWRYEDGIYIFKRGYNGETTKITAAESAAYTFTVDDLRVKSGTKEDGVIREAGGRESTETIWWGPYATLPPGVYEAEFQIRSNSESGDPVGELEVTRDQSNTVLASKAVGSTDGWQTVTVRFEVAELARDVEFRGRKTQTEGELAVRNIRVQSVEE